MKNISYKPVIVFKIMIVLLFINLPLFAATNAQEVSQISSYSQVSMSQGALEDERNEDALGSLGLLGGFVLVALTSLIGGYLLRNEV